MNAGVERTGVEVRQVGQTQPTQPGGKRANL